MGCRIWVLAFPFLMLLKDTGFPHFGFGTIIWKWIASALKSEHTLAESVLHLWQTPEWALTWPLKCLKVRASSCYWDLLSFMYHLKSLKFWDNEIFWIWSWRKWLRLDFLGLKSVLFSVIWFQMACVLSPPLVSLLYLSANWEVREMD